MARVSAAGEQDALRGYGYQYDHIAAAVYDLYLARRGFELRLVDPEAGAADDCVLVVEPDEAGTRWEVHGYQYKSGSASLTLASLLAEDKDRRGQRKRSLLAQLVGGWRSLKASHGDRDIIVHLVTPGQLSAHDRPLAAALKATGAQPGPRNVPHPRHTAAFVASVMHPLAAGCRLEEIEPGWGPVLQWICQRAGLAAAEAGAFIRSLRIEADTPGALPPMQADMALGQRAEDVRQLAEVLRRRVQESRAGEAVVLVPADVAALAGFGTRGLVRHSHRFPVDLDRYTPLIGAEQALIAAVDAVQQGYLAVLGPPGSGKSTLLAQVTPGLADRVLTYLTFVPGDPAAAGRASAADFLHDLVVELEHSGLGSRNSLPERDISELRLRFRDLLAATAQGFAQTGKRTLLIVDGLDHVARLNPVQALLAELPAPDAVPAGVVIVVGSQTTAPLEERIRHHLSESAPGNVGRVVDLAHHRLTAAAVEGVCQRLAESTPALRFSVQQVARVVDLVAGHPLALGYVCNALMDMLGDQQLPDSPDSTPNLVVPAPVIDAALNRCVRYSGSVADDYAAYLADVDDSDALRELLGDLARLRSPLNMRWVQTWASRAALKGLLRVKHLFRRLDRYSWMFFHDSFRRFVLEVTSVDALGETDAAANARRHSVLADECAKAPAQSRERGEEFFHAIRAGLNDRASALATPDRFRARFLSGTSPAVLAEDIRLAMQLTAQAGDASALVDLMLVQAELQSREQALQSVDVTGLQLDVQEPAAAIAYALPDGLLRVSTHQALAAAIRLDGLGHPAGKLLFDAADVYDLATLSGTDQWEVLSAWAEGVVRFRPLSVLRTALRRLFDQALSRLTTGLETRGGHDAFAVGKLAVYVARHAASELWLAGRHADAEDIAGQLREHAAALAAMVPNDQTASWPQRLLGAAHAAVATTCIAQASALADGGQWDDALAALGDIPSEGGDSTNESRLGAGAAMYGYLGQAVVVALRIVIAASRQITEHAGGRGSAPSQAEQRDLNQGRSEATRDAALAHANALLDNVGPPPSIVSGDLSSATERADALVEAIRVRGSHMVIAGLAAQSAGQPIDDDLLWRALPALAGPPADQPAGADIDPAAWAHRDRPAIEYAARLDSAVTVLAALNAAITLGGLPQATLRGLVARAVTALPALPNDLVASSRVRPHYATYWEMLIEVAARHSSELAGYVGEKIGQATAPHPQNRPGPAATANQSYICRLRQRLGLRLLEHGVRAKWLDGAIADADTEIAASPGAYEHLEVLATQVTAHAQRGEVDRARQLLSQILPESFSAHWRKDNQLEEWVRWLLDATGTQPGALIAEATDIAPLLAALTEATDGSAAAAGAMLLQGVAHVAPRPAVRLATWQLSHGALSFAQAHESLAAGFADALIDVITDDPSALAAADNAAAVLGATMAGILAPTCRAAPSRALERTAEFLGLLSPRCSSAIKEQLARTVDVHVLPSIRSTWRETLSLPSTLTSSRDTAEEHTRRTPEPTDGQYSRWGKSEYGLYKAADRTTTDPETVRQSITELKGALAWRSAQGEAGTFAWLPVLQPFITHASREQLEQIADAFQAVHDTAAVLVAVAQRMQEIGDPNAASKIARRALEAAEPVSWSDSHGEAVRRKAWNLLIAHGGDSVRREGLCDLAGLLTSADYWPGLLMLELGEILPVVAPGLPAAAVWKQVRQYLQEMRAGVTEPSPPILDGPLRAGWWAPPRATVSAPLPEATSARPGNTGEQRTPVRPDAASVGDALAELLILHLDHPMWAVREGAAAALAWLLQYGGPHARLADARASAVLASTGDHPTLADSLPHATEESSARKGSSPPGLAVTAPRASIDVEGLGGDGVREMAARTVAAAALGSERAKTLASLTAATASRTWIAAECARQARPGAASPVQSRPLPAAYRLSLPAPSRSGLNLQDPSIDMGPYGVRARELATAAGLSPNTVLHRLWRLTELAQQRIPDGTAVDRAARATALDGLLSAPIGQALRAAFGAIVAELAAAARVKADDAELAPLLELADIGLVRQPFSPVPGWIPVPVVHEWIPDDQWLSAAADRLAEYKACLTSLDCQSEPGGASAVTLVCDMLSGVTLEFGPIAAVIGADHELAITDQGHPTERYLLASRFEDRTDSRIDVPSGMVLPSAASPAIRMIQVEDWLLTDGTPKDTSGPASRGDLTGRPLIVNTQSAVLHTNAASWVCLDPGIAAYHGWRPHAQQPLCWQHPDGGLMAATMIWRRASLDIRRGDHDTVGEGSAVVVTRAGLRALSGTAGISRTHRVTRTVRHREDSDPSAPPRQTAIGELPTLTGDDC